VLEEGRYGLLFDGQDPDALAATLLAQVEAPVRPGDRALAYDLSLTNDAYAALIVEVLASGSARWTPSTGPAFAGR
jgi:hypothetical protein